MAAGNFVALLFMGLVLWSVFAIFGDPWETQEARLVVPTLSQVDTMPTASVVPLPETMPIETIGQPRR